MKMVDHNHFICHFYCCFSLFPHIYDVRKKSDDRLKRPRIKSPAKQFTPASIR